MEETFLSHFHWLNGRLGNLHTVLQRWFIVSPAGDKLLEDRDCILCFDRKLWSLKYTLFKYDFFFSFSRGRERDTEMETLMIGK